jgi:hypothetical protein
MAGVYELIREYDIALLLLKHPTKVAINKLEEVILPEELTCYGQQGEFLVMHLALGNSS